MCGARADTAPPKRFVCSMRIRSLKWACWRVVATRARRLPIIFRCCARRRTSFPRKARCVRHCVPAMSSLPLPHTAKRMRTCRDSSKPVRASSTFLPTIALTTAPRMGCRNGSTRRSLMPSLLQIRAVIRPRRLLGLLPLRRACDPTDATHRRCEERDYRCGAQARNRIALCRGRGRHSRVRHRADIAISPRSSVCCASNAIELPLVFTPHVVPLARGMLADSYAVFDRVLDEARVRRAYASAYATARSSESSREIAFPALPQ